MGKTRKITLSQGKFATVDAEDFEYLNQWKWCYVPNGYAIRTSHKGELGDGKRRTVLMHREVNKTPKGMLTDHINRDKLDNRKINVRSCTDSQNSSNRHANPKRKTSNYRGVSWQNCRKQWRAQIEKKGKQYYLGGHDDEEAAARAYDKAAIELHGEFAVLNNLEEAA